MNYTATLDYTATLGRWNNAHNPAAIGALHRKHHGAVRFGEQGVIMATANIKPGVKVGAALPDNDVTGYYLLATKALNT